MSAVDTTTNWCLNFEYLPGCRLNTHAHRFFTVHPDKPWYFTSLPGAIGKLVLTSSDVDVATAIGPLSAPNPAATGMVFVTRKL